MAQLHKDILLYGCPVERTDVFFISKGKPEYGLIRWTERDRAWGKRLFIPLADTHLSV
jgi:hypothetical protein